MTGLNENTAEWVVRILVFSMVAFFMYQDIKKIKNNLQRLEFSNIMLSSPENRLLIKNS